MLNEIGEKGQEKIKNARVLVIGAGGLGSPVLYYLAAAGVGKLGIVDNDTVDKSNLQRQILHFTGDTGKNKVDSAREKLTSLNPEVEILTYNNKLQYHFAREIIADYDIIVTAVDNYETRYTVNQICVNKKKPLIEGGIRGFDGSVFTIIPGEGPCFNCIYPEQNDSAPQEFGVLGPTAGITGSLQAMEVLKYILNTGEILCGQILFFSALTTDFNKIAVKRNPECPVCGDDLKGE